jgi:hypothetical protein
VGISLKGVTATVLAAAFLVVGADYMSVAATGHGLVLGQVNKADGPTVLTNTGDRGAAVEEHRREGAGDLGPARWGTPCTALVPPIETGYVGHGPFRIASRPDSMRRAASVAGRRSTD